MCLHLGNGVFAYRSQWAVECANREGLEDGTYDWTEVCSTENSEAHCI